MTSNLTIGNRGGGNSEDDHGLRAHYEDRNWENFSGGVSEIIEEEFSGSGGAFDIDNNIGVINKPLESIKEDSSLFSFDFQGAGDENIVYVAVGKQNEETASMDALIWAINNAVIPSYTLVFLIHVFPETKYIPTPLGKLQISQVNPEQKENYMAQERGKRREFLQIFLNVCTKSQVKVDTILIESDMEAKAMLDLIPILNIRKLVMGTTKSNLRRMRSRKGNGGVIDQIVQNAPEFCDVKIICEGKEMGDQLVVEPSPSSSPSPSPSPRGNDGSPKFTRDQQPSNNDSFACGCFKI